MIGPEGLEKAKGGRPKKKPGYDREREMQSLIQQAAALFEEPFDDRKERSRDLPTISSVAEKMNTSRIRATMVPLVMVALPTSPSSANYSSTPSLRARSWVNATRP